MVNTRSTKDTQQKKQGQEPESTTGKGASETKEPRLPRFEKTPLEEVAKGPIRVDTTEELPPFGEYGRTSPVSDPEDEEEATPRRTFLPDKIPRFKKDTRKYPDRLDMLSGVVKNVYSRRSRSMEPQGPRTAF